MRSERVQVDSIATGFSGLRARYAAPLQVLIALTALLHGFYGEPLGNFTPDQYAAFRRLNLYSVITLSIFVLWSLYPSRLAPARG